MIAKHIIVKGRVQGVFFRRNAQQKANELNIKGWIRNTDDENVEIMAQGDENNLQQFIEWCKEGPGRAEVKDVEIKDAGVNNSLSRFSIVH
jgi:acylphosphatase